MDPSWTSCITSSVTQLFQNPEVIIPYRLEQSSKLAFEPQDSFTNALEVVNYIRYISCRVNRGKDVVANFELLKEVLINETPFNEPHYAIEMIIFMLEKAKTCVATLNKIYNQRKSIDNGVTLKKKEIYDLLSACFFCCFSQERVNQIKLIDFARLYEKHCEENPQYSMNSAKKEKIKCLLNYFKYGYKNYNEQYMREDVTITKDVLHEMPNWTHSSEIINNNNPTVYIDDTYTIDLRKTEPRIVFLNQLSEASANGSLAEEIMFIVCPELIVSRFVMAIVGLDRLDEFLSVKGVHVHSVYEGTAESFKCIRVPPSISIVSTFQVALIAASDFSNDELSQYSKDSVEEELNKALVAFRACGENRDVVLSGNWGGANLKGDPILKAKIQMIAAAKADRRVHYYTFNEPGLADKLNSPLNNPPVMNPTTGKEYDALLEWCKKQKMEKEEQMTRQLENQQQ